MKRRQFVQAVSLGTVAAMAGALGCAQATGAVAADFRRAVQRIEKNSGGRLGVAVLDTASGTAQAYRGHERFPMCSTFKFLLAAQVLAQVDLGQESLGRTMAVLPADLLPYAPVTQPRVGGPPMTVAELCEAAVTLSDNTAANLLLRGLAGPPGLTAYARSLGDEFTRLDRVEPSLNQAIPGDPRDTTTPEAMLGTLQKIVLGNALSPASRAQITRWLVGSQTGGQKLRAQLPAGWRVGDKTGAGAYGTNNDIGVLWPPGRAPVLVTSYLTETSVDQAARDQALAEVGRLVASLVG